MYGILTEKPRGLPSLWVSDQSILAIMTGELSHVFNEEIIVPYMKLTDNRKEEAMSQHYL